jgi:hypothetical protein
MWYISVLSESFWLGFLKKLPYHYFFWMREFQLHFSGFHYENVKNAEKSKEFFGDMLYSLSKLYNLHFIELTLLYIYPFILFCCRFPSNYITLHVFFLEFNNWQSFFFFFDVKFTYNKMCKSYVVPWPNFEIYMQLCSPNLLSRCGTWAVCGAHLQTPHWRGRVRGILNLRQLGLHSEFEGNLHYIVRPYLKAKQNKKMWDIITVSNFPHASSQSFPTSPQHSAELTSVLMFSSFCLS